MKKLLIALITLGFVAGCDDDPDPVKTDSPIEITIQHLWNTSAFELNTWYTTAQGDSFSPTTLNYHINHIDLIDADGMATEVADWDLINFEKSGDKMFTVSDVPDKVFKKIRFTIGVEDSVANADGELNDNFVDPMYWGMAMGYINLKLEGKSMMNGSEGNVYFHIGGYVGANQTARTIELDFPSDVRGFVGENTVGVNFDVEDFFHSPNPISLATTNDVQTTGSTAVMISENWDSMFSVD